MGYQPAIKESRTGSDILPVQLRGFDETGLADALRACANFIDTLPEGQLNCWDVLVRFEQEFDPDDRDEVGAALITVYCNRASVSEEK